MTSIASRPVEVASRAVERLSRDGVAVTAARIVVVGAAYKAGVEDTRESPALELISRLRAFGADVQYVDPLVPSLVMPDGTSVESVDAPAEQPWDLAIIHVLQPSVSWSWLDALPRVMDPGGVLAGRSPAEAAVVGRMREPVEPATEAVVRADSSLSGRSADPAVPAA